MKKFFLEVKNVKKYTLIVHVIFFGMTFPHVAMAHYHPPDFTTFDIDRNTQAGLSIGFNGSSFNYTLFIRNQIEEHTIVSVETEPVSIMDFGSDTLRNSFINSILRIETTFEPDDSSNFDLSAGLFFQSPLLDFSRCEAGVCVRLEESITSLGLTILDYSAFVNRTGFGDRWLSDLYDFRDYQLNEVGVSEPETLGLFLNGLVGLLYFRKRHKT